MDLEVGPKKRIEIVPNRSKETDRQPDLRVYTEHRVEIGDGWNKVGQSSGNSIQTI